MFRSIRRALTKCRDRLRRFTETEDDLETQRVTKMCNTQLAAMRQLAGAAAHEISNPLAILDGYAIRLERLLQAPTVDREIAMESVAKIRSTITRIARTVNTLRSVSRDDSADPMTLVPLRSIIEDALKLWRQRIEDRGVALRWTEVPPSVLIRCRPAQVSQVLGNLLSNSLEAVAKSTEKWINLEFSEEESVICLAVTDSGPGIPEEIRGQLMKPFFTTKERGKGSGLGLNISDRIVREHGGNFFLDKKSDKTRFVIKLPKTETPGQV